MAYPKLTEKQGAVETAAAIRSGDVSPSEAVDAAIGRIEELDAHINAIAVTDFDRATEMARGMDGKRPSDDQPLFGVPMTVKESFDVADLPTTYGLEKYANNIARNDARLVQRLKRAGAIIIGKTNVPPDLTDWQSNNPVYGRTNNPHDHARSPGGSSGGSAAAIASGMVAAEFGTDIGGSIRVPAHFCGVWGHKPSWGVTSKRGHQSPARAGQVIHDAYLSVAGPLARCGEDLAVLMAISAERPIARSARPLEHCRILAVTQIEGAPVDASVLDPIDAAISALESAGVRVDRTSDLIPDLATHNRQYVRMMNTSMERGAPREDGTQASATDWFEMMDMQAASEHAWEQLFETYDFVLAPPAPVLATPHVEGNLFRTKLDINGGQVPAPSGLAWAGIATFPNLPSTVVPIGASSGLPCGMQVIGPRWSDLDCIDAAIGIDAVVNR